MSRIDPKRVRSFADRVERINEQIADLNADKREIFAEARGQGHDVKALKAAIKIWHQRAADSAGFQEHQHLVEMYLNALDRPEETGHARAPAPRTRDRPPPTQAMGIAVDPDPNVTIINETPAPTTPPGVGGGQPQPSVPASLPEAAASTSDPGPVGQGVTEGAPPADQTQSPSLSAPEEADCSVAGELIRPSGVSADETEGDGLAGGGDGAAAATSDDGLDIPTFMKRDANNRAPWMETAD